MSCELRVAIKSETVFKRNNSLTQQRLSTAQGRFQCDCLGVEGDVNMERDSVKDH